MDWLFLNSISFPVQRATLSKAQHFVDSRRWSIKIQCAESEQLKYSEWTDDRDEQELDWIAGAEPYLYAQSLPIDVDAPHHLLGNTFHFHQAPTDNPAAWDCGEGWLFFGMYVWEHSLVFPVTISFVEELHQHYRVRIEGKYPVNQASYDLKADVRLQWLPNDA